MSDQDNVSRRDFLRRLSAFGFVGLGGSVLLSACGGDESSEGGADAGATTASSDACNDLSGLTESEKTRRANQIDALQYVAETPNPDQKCSNCQFWKPEAYESPCGGCLLFPGPVKDEGYCRSWVAG